MFSVHRQQGASDGAPFMLGDEQDPGLWAGQGGGLPERWREVGLLAALQVGLGVAAVEKIPIGGRDVCAFPDLELHPGLADLAALLQDFLALVAVQAGQEVVEIGKGLGLAVAPVELHAVAQQPAAALGLLRFGLAQKQQVGRGPTLLRTLGLQRVQQGLAHGHLRRGVQPRVHQQALSRNRRKRHGAQQLGEVMVSV